MKKFYVLIIYGGDTLQGGTQCGVQTMRRLEHAIKFLRKHRGLHFKIILAAGKDPNNPTYPPLNGIMKDYLQRRFVDELRYGRLNQLPEIILAEKDAWTTFNETVAALYELRKMGATQIYALSSWYHMPRILFIWTIVAGFKIGVFPVAAPGPLPFLSLLRELAGFPTVFVRWYKWKKSLS